MAEDSIGRGRWGAVAVVLVSAVLWVGKAAVAQPADSPEALYRAAVSSYQRGPEEYETAAAAFVAAGQEGVDYLVRQARLQAERVRDAEEAVGGDILVTINLLGRMNSYAGARAALKKLLDHPVSEVAKWARYALARTPETRSSAPAPASAPRVEGDRIVLPGGYVLRPEVRRPPLPDKITKAFVIPIHGPIGRATLDAVRRKALRSRSSGAEIVIFEMDTPGGSMEAMRGIVRVIIDDLREVYTVAYVHPEAFSAGAIISLACSEIVLSPTAVIGDAMPIMIGPSGQIVPIPEKERGKFESAARGEIRILAKRNGYSSALCEAMITITMEIWEIRNRNTGEIRFVDAAEWRGRVSGAPSADEGAAAGEGPWEYVATIDRADELVTMTADEAVRLGFAEHILATMEDLRRHYNIVEEPIALVDNWSERLVGVLSSPAALGFLLFVALLCAYVEINTPGFGVAGAMPWAWFWCWWSCSSRRGSG